jgi:prepilin-type N-terminal cleavage/methylation domain-containing protein
VVERKGFTLVELMVVVAIVTILAGASVPYLGRYVSRRQLEAASFELVQDLRRVQADAVFTRTVRKVEFWPRQNLYRFETAAEAIGFPTDQSHVVVRQLSDAVGFPFAFGKTYPNSAYFGWSVYNTCPASTIVKLSFNEWGRPSQGGGQVTFVTRGGDQVSVIVTPVIGRIRMEWVH